MLALAQGLVLAGAPESVPTPALNTAALVERAKSRAKSRAQAGDPTGDAFAAELPLVSDERTDFASLQQSAGWSYDRRTQALTIQVGLGAVTPNNFIAFDRLGLGSEPPLRTLFLATETRREDMVITDVDLQEGGLSQGHGWHVTARSYGLAIPAAAAAHGMSGGDLPDAFAPPVAIRVHVAPAQLDGLVRSVKLEVEGRLRTLGGHGVLCSDSEGDGYVVDERTQQTMSQVSAYQCLLPATLTRIALVRTDTGAVLRDWRRGAAPATGEGAGDAVIAAGTRGRATGDWLNPPSVNNLAVQPPRN